MSAASSAFFTHYGPWAVVTGASSGIGRAIAVELASKGLNTVLVARSRAALETLAEELATRFGVEARAVAADLGREGALHAVASATRDLDVGLLVAAAGYGTSGPFLDASPATERDMLAVNAGAVFDATHHFGNRLARRGRGGVILIGSVVGFQGTPWSAHYAATKAYVHALGEALRVEWAPRGIDVLLAAPGPTRSGFSERARMTMAAALDPTDVARATVSALGRRATVLPGSLSKLLGWSLATLPRWARVRVMGRVMHRMAGVGA
ncbi:MAG TPA: SDR family oxidoreductase [Gemmatimonadales bacterium]|nr:SDR family oxidoreductase [Gemmatimonadales bacterium]